MNIHITTFKNLPLKLRIIGYFLAIYAFVILFTLLYLSYMMYIGKLLSGYILIVGINALVVAISSLVFVGYRVKRR